jgi:hypothetical protein
MHDLRTGLTLVALLAAALQYAVLVRHRVEERLAQRARQEAGDTGLQGLVRVFLADKPTTAATYRPE